MISFARAFLIRQRRPTILAWLGLGCSLGMAGCGGSGQDVDTSRPSEFGFQTSVYTTLVEEGKLAYQTYCIGCHGVDGDGNGEAARFLSPRPRNFQRANFKFSATRAGQLPTDEDLRRTIVNGLRGSAMPGWDLLPARTVRALISYVKTFSPKWEERNPAPPIPIVDDPYRAERDKSPAIARGETVYHGFATCWTCHPSYASKAEINKHLAAMDNPARDAFRKGLFQSESKPNADGEVIFPPDFRRDFVRSGSHIEDLYRSIAAGITGTAMPTWVDSMDIPPFVQTSDIWALAYYVQSLILERPAKLADAGLAVRDRRQIIYKPGEKPEPSPPEQDEGTELGEEFEEDE